ncbi:MAG: HD-GYP domain-containing protein [Actinobacteria bacterium]|nr:HD-GYP domain-containing protein [Actinomycetota bacterium]
MSGGTATAPAQAGGRGRHLVMALSAAIRTAAYYDPGNAVMQHACTTLAELMADQTEQDGSVTVGIHSHCVFLGKARVRTTVSTHERFTFLVQLFESWGINTLTFFAGLAEDELMRALLVLARANRTDSPGLAEAFHAEGVERILIDTIGAGSQIQAVAPVEAYAAAMQLSIDLGEGASAGERGTGRRLRHVTQAVVDQILRDPRSLVALTTIKDFDRYLITHSTNVAVLSVLLGQRLGLSKARLGELCLAAFLHDAGKLEVDPEVLQKPGALDDEEWEEMRRHPVLAAHGLLGGQRLTPASMRAVVVAFEHHLNYDLSGYPRTEVKDSVSLFGNIVAIADRYDALTTARVYRKRNFTPHETLVYLLTNAGTLFDPILVKLFAEMVGLYPPGTVVELSGGEVGVVSEPPRLGSPLDRPLVRLIAGEDSGAVRDLSEQQNGGFVRSVVNVLNPADKGQLPGVDPSIFTLEQQGGD